MTFTFRVKRERTREGVNNRETMSLIKAKGVSTNKGCDTVVQRMTTSTATSLLQEAFESLSFHALFVSISSTLSHLSLILTQCLAIGLPKIKAITSSSKLRCLRSEMKRPASLLAAFYTIEEHSHLPYVPSTFRDVQIRSRPDDRST